MKVLDTAPIVMDALGLYLEASKFATVFNRKDALEDASLVVDCGFTSLRFDRKDSYLEALKLAILSVKKGLMLYF